jgi:hypothetical protein
MENMDFNPLEWAQSEPSSNPQPRVETINDQPQGGQVGNMTTADFSTDLQRAQAVCEELISRGANIAESYDDYLKLGFALADGLGSDGRDIFHQLCAQSVKYREADCEKKWLECLSKRDGRTTIATFYDMAKRNGVDLSAISRQFPATPAVPHGFSENVHGEGKRMSDAGQGINNQSINNYQGDVNGSFDKEKGCRAGLRELRDSEAPEGAALTFTETFSDRLETSSLPLLLRQPVEMRQDAEDRDKLLLSATTDYSGVMPNVYGIYGEKRVYAPLYQLVNAPSGARKGEIVACRQLLMPIEYEIRQQMAIEQAEYEKQVADIAALPPQQRKQQQQPKEPEYRSVFLAANSSATGLYHDLAANGEWGVIHESEADTLTQAMGQEFGQFSDGLRKAFHHEPITYTRRTEKEHVSIDHPRVAMLLTCTPGQIPLLMPGKEVANGLANRYLYYCLKGGHEWRSPFAGCETPLDDRIYEVGKQYLALYHALQQRRDHPIQFTLTREQEARFDDHFKQLLPEQMGLYGEDFDAFVYRLGLSAFRMMMVFTVLRCFERQPYLSDDTQVLVCSDTDYQTVMTIIGTLVNHTAHVFTNLLPHDDLSSQLTAVKMTQQEITLFRELPDAFTTGECLELAPKLGMNRRTAERYLGNFFSKYHLVKRPSLGHYQKVSE